MPTGTLYVPNDEDRATLVQGLKLDVPLARIAEKIGVSIPTLEKHYGDVIAAAELKRGAKPFQPTAEHRQIVRLGAAAGRPHEAIAKLIGCSKKTLEKYFDDDLSLGVEQANFKVGGNLFRMATGPTSDKTTLGAAIFWAKCRMGWKETSRVENTGADGEPLPPQGTVVVMLPDNGRGDCTLPTVPYEPYPDEENWITSGNRGRDDE